MARSKDRLFKRGELWWTWWYVPEVRPDGSVRKRRKSGSTGQRDRTLARAAARRIERESVVAAEAPAALTLADALARYMTQLEAVERAPATIRFYEQKSKPLLRLLGAETDVHALGALHADAYLATRKKEGVKIATVAKELGALRATLKSAKRRKLYEGDPDWCVPPEIRGAYVPRERALTLTEYKKLHAELSEERRDYLEVYVGLGVRDSELYRIGPADWTGGRIHIHGKKGRKDRADRWLTPPPDVAEVLTRRAKGRSGPLFPAWGNVRRDLAAACERAGIPAVTPNDLRRTFATWLAEAGIPELVTASLMGHANSSMVRRVYARIGSAAQQGAVAVLPRLRTADEPRRGPGAGRRTSEAATSNATLRRKTKTNRPKNKGRRHGSPVD